MVIGAASRSAQILASSVDAYGYRRDGGPLRQQRACPQPVTHKILSRVLKQIRNDGDADVMALLRMALAHKQRREVEQVMKAVERWYLRSPFCIDQIRPIALFVASEGQGNASVRAKMILERDELANLNKRWIA